MASRVIPLERNRVRVELDTRLSGKPNEEDCQKATDEPRKGRFQVPRSFGGGGGYQRAVLFGEGTGERTEQDFAEDFHGFTIKMPLDGNDAGSARQSQCNHVGVNEISSTVVMPFSRASGWFNKM